MIYILEIWSHIVIVFCAILIILMVYSRFSKNRFFCDKFNWHNPKDIINNTWDGCSFGGKCKRCDCRVLADSNGDYFKV